MCKRRLENERRRADSDECLWKGRRGAFEWGRNCDFAVIHECCIVPVDHYRGFCVGELIGVFEERVRPWTIQKGK